MLGDCRAVLKTLPDVSVDSVVCDPPYELGFMGKEWDASGIAYDGAVWSQVLRVLKPGGHLLAFGGSRTYHRMACAIEDAGFEIRDQIMWVYGSGFPKSLDVSKAIDKAAGEVREVIRIDASQVRNPKASGGGRDGTPGATRPWIEKAMAAGFHEKSSDIPATDAARRWQGWGTALKPAHEPIVVARRPLIGTVADNVLAFGTGAVNVDGCRVGNEGGCAGAGAGAGARVFGDGLNGTFAQPVPGLGRWPANLIHDGSAEVVERFPDNRPSGGSTIRSANRPSEYGMAEIERAVYADSGSAARFFYTPKADATDRDEGLEGFDLRQASQRNAYSGLPDLRMDHEQARNGRSNHHPTVKPTDLMRYLCRLVTPRGGIVLDPFMGSGSTGKAAALEQFDFIGIELDPDYLQIARARIAHLGTAPAVDGMTLRSVQPPAGAQLALAFAA